MGSHELVVDTNVFYTFIRESSYSNDFDVCSAFLHNVLVFCENKICINEEISNELERFKKVALKSNFRNVFTPWFVKMEERNKFKIVQPATYINPGVHHKDIKFYQTALNTNTKIFVTSEVKLLKERMKINKKYGIETLSIKQANERVVDYHSNLG